MTSKKNTLLIISGPTAVGKTDLCIKLAIKFNTFIISADSRQFYREMNIGTAKPSTKELEEVTHFFVDTLSIHDAYDVAKFEKDALNIIEQHAISPQPLIMTGGSGMYIDAVAYGLDDMPQVEMQIRNELIRLHETEGINALQEKLSLLDPDYFSQVDLQNPQRLIRALEVCIGTGTPYSAFRTKKRVTRPFTIIKIALERDRNELYNRIDMRMDQMIEAGLFEEAADLFPYKHLNALQTVGYKEIFGFMEGRYDREEAVRLLKRNSRRYAKRQLTWLKKDTSYTWFHPSDTEGVLDFISHQMSL